MFLMYMSIMSMFMSMLCLCLCHVYVTVQWLNIYVLSKIEPFSSICSFLCVYRCRHIAVTRCQPSCHRHYHNLLAMQLDDQFLCIYFCKAISLSHEMTTAFIISKCILQNKLYVCIYVSFVQQNAIY